MESIEQVDVKRVMLVNCIQIKSSRIGVENGQAFIKKILIAISSQKFLFYESGIGVNQMTVLALDQIKTEFTAYDSIILTLAEHAVDRLGIIRHQSGFLIYTTFDGLHLARSREIKLGTVPNLS